MTRHYDHEWIYCTLSRSSTVDRWLELGADEMSDSLVRVLDEGELVWESSAKVTIDEALAKAEIYVSEYMKELGE